MTPYSIPQRLLTGARRTARFFIQTVAESTGDTTHREPPGLPRQHRAPRREFPWPSQSAARYEIVKGALERTHGCRLVLEVLLWFAEADLDDLCRRYQ